MIEASTGRSPITWRDRALATVYFREPTQDVLHLHGHYRQPETVILGARSYGEVCRDEFAQTALRGLMISGTLVFVGCGAGLGDPNFGVLLDWGGERPSRSATTPISSLCVAARSRNGERSLKGMPIDPVPYGVEYLELTPFLKALAERIRRRRVQEPLSLLSSSQTNFDAQWEELERNREQLPVLDYFRRSRLLAAELWRAGGRRRAVMAFSGRLTYKGQGLLIPEYFEFALDAAEWLLEEDLPSLASHHLSKIGQELESADIPAQQLSRFRRLRVCCMDALCAYTEALSAIEEALPHADHEERGRLEAERSEIHFLQGNFDQAVDDPL